MARRGRALSVLLVGVLAGAVAPARGADYRSAGPPIVEAGPGGHAVAIARLDRVGRLGYSFAAPGAAFTPPVAQGRALSIAALAVDGAGDGGGADATLFTLGRDGRGGGEVVAGQAQARALAVASDGRALAVVSRPRELRAVLVGAGGRQGEDGVLVDDSFTHGIEVLGAVLGPGGDAAVAWRERTVVVAEGDAVAGFAPPRRIGRPGEVAAARFAAGARGDAVLAWSSYGYRPRVSMRPAGGRFGPATVVSSRAGAPPSATMLPDGAALLGWDESTVLTRRQVVARVDGTAVTRRQVLASWRAVDVDPRARARCRAARAGALARTRWAVHRRVGRRGDREVCSLVTGVTLRLRAGVVLGSFLQTIRLAGPLVAWGTITGEDVGTSPYETAAVRVLDTRTGHSPGALGIDALGDNLLVSDLVLARDGAVAVIVCRDPVCAGGRADAPDAAPRWSPATSSGAMAGSWTAAGRSIRGRCGCAGGGSRGATPAAPARPPCAGSASRADLRRATHGRRRRFAVGSLSRMEDEDDDWVDDETYARRVREGGRLESVRRAVEPTHYEAVEAPDPAIRIRYRQAGTVQGPNDPLAEVVVSEGFDVVAVTLFERIVWGVFPSGLEASEKLAGVTSFVEIGLQRPLGARPVIDGATGRRLEPLEHDPAAGERRRYGPAGCPRWV